ncbi:glycoside hydrolase family 19 protein [Deinococcus hopiensis]|uniref:Putative chitinase n=1 Tax=Deinococcus hopiensis KR-140 TaxID=695939 RepID=A0A1W1UX33_9DEIO|nr:glycoside hydrolase family 19 protein [Deinococcus hopiensis]SMB85725.1 putative chitinase [Deinococcus hopiensis KR-140]
MNLILQPEHIRAVAPRNPDLQAVVDALRPVLERHGIDRSPERLGMFLAQWAHESEFLGVRENLNYSQASRICQTWPRRFPTVASAAPYAGNPQALANKVYNGRMGNTGPNDGWAYRGGGWPQLTGRDAYRAYGQRIGLDLEGNPNLILQASVSAQVCGLFWADRGLNAAADQGDMVTITQRINGGQNGAQDRLERYHRVIPLLRDQQAALASQEAIVHPNIPWKRLFVNNTEFDPTTARLEGDTITLPSGQHQVVKKTQVGEKLYVTTRTP